MRARSIFGRLPQEDQPTRPGIQVPDDRVLKGGRVLDAPAGSLSTAQTIECAVKDLRLSLPGSQGVVHTPPGFRAGLTPHRPLLRVPESIESALPASSFLFGQRCQDRLDLRPERLPSLRR